MKLAKSNPVKLRRTELASMVIKLSESVKALIVENKALKSKVKEYESTVPKNKTE